MAITIPGSATAAGTSLAALLTAAGYAGDIRSAVISKSQPGVAGSHRAAFIVGSRRPGAAAVVAADITTHGKFITAGEEWYEPSSAAGFVNLRSADASAVPALVTVFPA